MVRTCSKADEGCWSSSISERNVLDASSPLLIACPSFKKALKGGKRGEGKGKGKRRRKPATSYARLS